MKLIRAKQTIAGSYGQLSEGETTTVSDKTASDLEKNGLVEIVEDAGEDKKEENDSSIKISDNTSNEKRNVLVKDEKDSSAGPSNKKKDKDK